MNIIHSIISRSGRFSVRGIVLICCAVALVSGCGNDPTQPPNPSDTDLDGERINSFYTNEEIQYLLDIALKEDVRFTNPVISRWLFSPNVALQGSPTEEDVATVHEVVEELDELTQDIRVTMDSTRPTITVYFTSRFAYTVIDSNYAYPDNSHTTFATQGGQYASIFVAIDSTTQEQRKGYIRRELARSLGFPNTSPKYPSSVFHTAWDPVSGLPYSRIDRTIIRMMYSTGLTLHMTCQDIIRRLTDR